jgi:hypothetical protein
MNKKQKLEYALYRAVEQMNSYAKQLNSIDGGNRPTPDVIEWVVASTVKAEMQVLGRAVRLSKIK